jgi:hypothetical protein
MMHELSSCPHCGVGYDIGSDMSDEPYVPETGDFELCYECGDWAVYTIDGQRRKPNDDELTRLATDPDLLRETRSYWRYRWEHPRRWSNRRSWPGR